MNADNQELQLAEAFVQHTNCNVFLTGRAGTGKTTFLHTVKKQSEKRLVVTAPTGVAAINAGGVTLHSFFQMPFTPYVPGNDMFTSQNRHRMSRDKRNIINSLDLLIIDEISMVRADLLDCVDAVLRRYRRSDSPFGGVQLLMIGDLQQLPPVVKDSDWQILRQHYDSPYFFSSNALRQSELIHLELQRIYRQTDKRFIGLLNQVRDNTLTPTALAELNERHKPEFQPEDDDGYIALCTHNHSADSINSAKLHSLAAAGHQFSADVSGDFPEHAYPTAASLELKKGAQVMFLRNDTSPEKRYYNGKIGTVTAISTNEIEVLCPNDQEAIPVEKSTWENIEYTVDKDTTEISEHIIGTFAQYPLKLAWAITIHKSQGLTFDRAIIDAQAAFAHGQVYVALSRCRTFEGMVLSTELTSASIKTDRTVDSFVQKARKSNPSDEILTTAKIRYQQQLLMECYSFQTLRSALSRLISVINRNITVIHLTGIKDIGEFERQVLAEIFTVGENFKRQLQGLFQHNVEPATDPVITGRLTKAATYFQEKIEGILTPFITTAQVETDNKEVKKQIKNSSKWLREETVVKLAAVTSCRDGFSPKSYLRALSAAEIEVAKPVKKPVAVTYTEADVGHPELFDALKEWRKKHAAAEGLAHFQVMHQKTLVQIAVHLPNTMTALKKIKGIGEKLAEKYGQELVELVTDYRRKKKIEEVVLPILSHLPAPEKPAPKKVSAKDTREESLALFQSGLSPEQIAEQRSLTLATIEKHLAHWLTEGDITIKALVVDSKRQAIEKALQDQPDDSLKELRASLGNDFSYGDIKLVQAHLACRDNS